MSKKSLRARIVADWPAKVLSLAVAILVFTFYRLNRLEDRYVSVPLAVTVGDEFVPSSSLPRSVRLTLRGESNALVTILEEDLKASVDLSRVTGEGVYKAPVLIEKRGSALGVDPLEITIDPPEIAVSLERKLRKVVPVTPSFRGYLGPGYELSSFSLEPAEEEVSGPASAVERIIDLSTDPIELSGKTSDFREEVRVFPKDPLVQVSGKATATFSAAILQAMDFKTFDAVPVTATGLAPGFALIDPLPTCVLRLRSNASILKNFVLPPGAIVLDLSSVTKAGIYTLPLDARLPEGIALDAIDPPAVTLRVQQQAAGGAH
ncbi:MAG TPA: CdaR family protein [Rectinemataceae bacterium]|nr:CdaR family protein [Rectinemataceae bacterium]